MKEIINLDEPFSELKRSIDAALLTYSNVHRGSGHKSIVTTSLFEKAREIVLQYLNLDPKRYVVIFCTPLRAAILQKSLEPGKYQRVTSADTGLPLAVVALAAEKKALPAGAPFHKGGGTTRLVSRDWEIWAKEPERFEAGTPAIINIITFAKALLLIQEYGRETFNGKIKENITDEKILYHDRLNGFTGKKYLEELKQDITGRDVMVPTTGGIKRFVNLDNAASTPALGASLEAFWLTLTGSEEASETIIRETRKICAEMAGAGPDNYDVIFTSNTTEAINVAAESFNMMSGDEVPVIVNTLMEHNSNDLPWRNRNLLRLGVDDNGLIDPVELEHLLCEYNSSTVHGRKRINLVTVTGASNVLGTYNDLEKISTIVHQYGAGLMVDAAQMIAHRKVCMEKWGVDYLVFSGHKAYAPFGAGVLIAKKGTLNMESPAVKTLKSSEKENVAGIAALGKSLVLLGKGMDEITLEEQSLTARALKGMAKVAGLKVYGVSAPESPFFGSKGGVIAFTLKNRMSDSVARDLAFNYGIGVRYGCHCSHLIVKHLLELSPFLENFQKMIVKMFPRLNLPGVARVSIGLGNNEEDVDTFIAALNRMASTRSATSKKLVKAQIDDFVKEAEKFVYG